MHVLQLKKIQKIGTKLIFKKDIKMINKNKK